LVAPVIGGDQVPLNLPTKFRTSALPRDWSTRIVPPPCGCCRSSRAWG